MTPADEAKRHQCEIDYVLAMPTKAERNQYLEMVAKARSQQAADRLRGDAMAKWKVRQESLPEAVRQHRGGLTPTLKEG